MVGFAHFGIPKCYTYYGGYIMSSRSLCLVPAKQPSRCDVVPFPAARRVGKVRRTVEVLLSKSGKGADHYWRQIVEGMKTQMTAAGIAQEQVDRELSAFAATVFDAVDAGRPADRKGE